MWLLADETGMQISRKDLWLCWLIPLAREACGVFLLQELVDKCSATGWLYLSVFVGSNSVPQFAQGNSVSLLFVEMLTFLRILVIFLAKVTNKLIRAKRNYTSTVMSRFSAMRERTVSWEKMVGGCLWRTWNEKAGKSISMMQSEMQASLKNKPGFTVLLKLGTCTNCSQYLMQSRCENVLFCYVHLMSDERNIWRGLRLMETYVLGVHDP